MGMVGVGSHGFENGLGGMSHVTQMSRILDTFASGNTSNPAPPTHLQTASPHPPLPPHSLTITLFPSSPIRSRVSPT